MTATPHNEEYQRFLDSKRLTAQSIGIAEPAEPHESLFPFQRDIVKWALKKGRACVFSGCGTGKTRMQLEWARQIPGDVLILAPLVVAQQTVEEAELLWMKVQYCRHQSEKTERIIITNYEMLEHFDAESFEGVVLDESSIIKHFEGKIRNQIITAFDNTPYRLACTATPAPNDHMELGNHAEFVGAMTRTEMLSMFFVHDGGDTSQWRLKGHAEKEFWKWVCSWAVMLRKPSDLGYEDGGFELPALHLHEHSVEVSKPVEGELFQMDARTLQERIGARRDSITERAIKCGEVVGDSKEQWLIFCNLNAEQDALEKQFGDNAVSIYGSLSMDEKASRLKSWLSGEKAICLSKSSIIGFGINGQCCHNVAFVGLSDSWEEYYQAVRRCWRFGQKNEVHVHQITSTAEGAVVANIKRKEADAEKMASEMVSHMHSINEQELKSTTRTEDEYATGCAEGPNWKIRLGDCVEGAKATPSDSVGFSIFSPPFASLYTYSASSRDMGNCKDDDEFMDHFRFLVAEIYRILIPGRLVSFHCMNLPTSKTRDGYIGIRDFRGDLIRIFQDAGFIYHSEVCIWKDPVTAMQRTKALGLLHKQIVKDSCMSRQGIPDYLVTMRKPGENPNPVSGEFDHWVGDESFKSEGRFSIDVWQRYASPVWMDINPSRTLQKQSARDEKDERHICLSAGSLVLTREHGYIEIEDVEFGDHVLTHMGRWMPVLAKRCNGVAETIRICGQGVADLVVTPDHKLWTREATWIRAKESAMRNEPKWIEASETLGSYLNLKLPPEENSKLTADEWWIVGRWLGDGHKGGHKRSGKRGGAGQFFISCAHEEASELISRLGIHAGHNAKRTATQIALINLRPEVRDVLSRCGHGAENKRLPGEAVTLNSELSESLLYGYLSADGHYVEKYDRVCASSVSRALLLGMAIVAQRAAGVVASVYAGRPDREGEIQGRRVSMMQDWIFSFRKTDGYRKSGWIGDDGAWKKVRKIEISDDREVWDLQIAEDSSFTAEGAIVHNCPLQLDVIERAMDMWSNPGDVVYSPFTGIGSEGYVAVQTGRKFLGDELKRSYWKQAVENVRQAETTTQQELF